MSVVGLAAEISDPRKGSFLEKDRRQYFRTYLVQTDSKWDGPLTVVNAPGIPAPYAQYQTNSESDPAALVTRREPKILDRSRTAWHVEVTYDTEYEKNDSPYLEPPTVEFDFEPYQEPLPGVPLQIDPPVVSAGGGNIVDGKIFFGAGITNSAGEPFDPPAEREAARPVITLTRNEPTFSTAIAVMFINSVNRDPWSGLEKRQALIRGIRASAIYKQPNSTTGAAGYWYWRVTYVFALRRETWDLNLLNIGTYALSTAVTFDANMNPSNASTIAKIPAEDAGGKHGKILLKADGTAVTDGVPSFRVFKVYRETSFALLNINLNTSGI